MRFSSGSYQLDLKFDKLDPFTSLKKNEEKSKEPSALFWSQSIAAIDWFQLFPVAFGVVICHWGRY